jgi:hypothetical protein
MVDRFVTVFMPAFDAMPRMLEGHLRELWCFSGYTGPDQEAYDRHLSGLPFAVSTVGRSRAAHQAISRVGLSKLPPLQQRRNHAMVNFVPERLRDVHGMGLRRRHSQIAAITSPTISVSASI